MKEFLLEHREFITKFVEVLAAITGSIYLRKTNNKKLSVFVYYLWLTVAVEFLGRYTYIMQRNFDYEWFINLKNSFFCYNTWLYNIYSFMAIGLLGIFYSDLLINKSFKIIIRFIFLGYSLFTIGYYILTNAFLEQSINYDFILGAIIIGIYVILYFIELMKSEYLLKYYTLPSFYISIALLLWYICATPLFIFDNYFKAINEGFVNFRHLVLLIINIFTYTCIIFGFWYSLYKGKLSMKSK